MNDESSVSMVDLASNLTVAWLSNPNVRANTEDATTFLKEIHSTLASLSKEGSPAEAGAQAAPGGPEPAVSVRKSLASRDHIVSLIDGKPYVTLKRHLAGHGLTPQQYRERYGLKADYPMVAPAYAEKRRELAKKIGLGRKGGARRKSAGQAAPGGAESKPARGRGRPRKSAA